MIAAMLEMASYLDTLPIEGYGIATSTYYDDSR